MARTLDDVRYFLRRGPPASWMFYIMLCAVEITITRSVSVNKKNIGNPFFFVIYIISSIWQVRLQYCSLKGKMVSPKITHCYNTLKIILYILPLFFSPTSREKSAIIAFITIYAVVDIYLYAVQYLHLPSFRALFSKTQPIYDLKPKDTTPLTHSAAPSAADSPPEKGKHYDPSAPDAPLEQDKPYNPSVPDAPPEQDKPYNPSVPEASDEAGGDIKPPQPSSSSRKYEEEECVICLINYCEKGPDAKLRCGHTFHRRCIREWLTVQNKCPLCRDAGTNNV